MDEISNIKFNLTPRMADKIVEINDIKVKLYEINQNIETSSGDRLNNLIKEKDILIKKMDMYKKQFIKEFQNNNKEQIKTYLDLKGDN